MIRRVVICDECFQEAETPDGLLTGLNATDTRTEARDYGWKITSRRDICPDCAAGA